jgi:hypothetical protein
MEERLDMAAQFQPVTEHASDEAATSGTEPSAAGRLLAVRDSYLMATPDKTDTPWAILTQSAELIDDLLGALKALWPRNLLLVPDHLPDDFVFPVDVTAAELRAARAAISKAESRS